MNTSWTQRSTILLIVLVVLCAATLPWTVHDVFLEDMDAAVYLRTARSLLDGQGYEFRGEPFSVRPPGYPVILMPLLAAFGQNFLALNLYMSLWGLACVAVFYRWLHPRLGDVPSFAVGAALWWNPQFQELTNSVMSELPGLTLLIVCLLLERWADRSPGRGRHVALGVAIAAATYVRSLSILLLPAMLCSRLFRRKPLRPALITLITCLALVAPWSVRDALQSHRGPAEQTWLHSQWTAMWHTDQGDPDSPTISREEFLARIPAQGEWILAGIGHRLRASEPTSAAFWAGSLAMLAFLIMAARRRRTEDAFVVGTLLVLLVWHAHPTRLLIPVFLFVLPVCVEVVRAALARARIEPLANWAPAVAVLGLAVVDVRDGVDWPTQEALHARYIANAREVADRLSETSVVAATDRAYLDSVYLERPVFSIRIVHRREGDRGANALIDQLGVTHVLSRTGRGVALRPTLSERFHRIGIGPGLMLYERTIPYGNPANPPLNVILISIDTLRSDHLGAWGHPVGTSPALDAFAAGAHTFADALAQAPWTLPSHASLMTSLYGRTHQTDDRRRQLPTHLPTLAGTLTDAGYTTHAVVSGPFMRTKFGLNAGFQTYDDTLAEVGHKKSHRLVTSGDIHDRALEFLDQDPQPFFLFLHYWDAHYDFIPPPPLDRRFDPDYQGTVTSDGFIDSPDIHRDMAAEDLRHIRSLFDGEIRWVDHHLARLFSELDARGLADNTVVALVADHGDEFFEHGEKGHQHSLYGELVQVPFIVRIPGVTAGTVHADPVEMVDVMPTLLETVGVAPPDGLQGRSLLPLVLRRPWESRPRFTETTKALKDRNGDWKGSSWAVLSGTRKLIQFDGDHFPAESYDLSADPGEQHTLGTDAWPDLYDAYHDWQERIPQGSAHDHEGMDENTLRTLESLGYVGD